jgi:transcriptional regulator with XRE-family HTH domain
MVIAAHFEPLPQLSGKQRAQRRRLQLEAVGALASGGTAAVVIHNVSATGLLLETATVLSDAERLEIELTGEDSAVAQVIWTSGRFYGCRFDTPLPGGTLSALELRSAALPQSGAAQDESFAARLHRLRKAKGLTLAAIAEALGVSKPTVWAWEQGRARPTPERLATLASQFGLSDVELASGRDSDALQDVLMQARSQIAETFGVSSAKVRIMIEL